MNSLTEQTWKRRVHPKLRVMLNCDPDVNAGRAAGAGCLNVSQKLVDEAGSPEAVAGSPKEAKAAKVKDLKKRSPARNQVRVNVFVQKRVPVKLKGTRAEMDTLAMLRLPLDEVETMAKELDGQIGFIEQGENLKRPGVTRLGMGTAQPKRNRHAVDGAALHHNGKGVLVGIIDVDGFDWLHPDFAAGDESRFIAIWDQGGDKGRRRAPNRRGKAWKRFDYGVEILPDHMKHARREARRIHVSPHDIEPQSQMVPGSHGTHVASIAAGNSGIASEAEIAAVLISVPEQDMERRKSFYDSTCLLDAVEYLIGLADERGMQVSINVSLGTNGHAHDGSSTLDRWIDALLAKPGRSLCVAAGNAGQERAEHPGDLGYMLGRIHTSGRIAAKGLRHDVEWVVHGDAVIDVSENELEIWYESQDRLEVSVKPPGGGKWFGPVKPGEYIENLQLEKGSMLSIYNELYNPANGSNYISIYLTPYIGRDKIVGIESGVWTVRLCGLEIRDGRFHGWIERDDPLDQGDDRYYWPSYFSERSNVDSSSVSSLACGQRVVSVANLDEAGERVNVSSSQGPTRDGRLKPDIAAPGTTILAANGFAGTKFPWIGMTGTSMASPYVAGVIALMFAVAETKTSRLSASQINGILKATAAPLPGTSYEWLDDSGFGMINLDGCIKEADLISCRCDVKERFE